MSRDRELEWARRHLEGVSDSAARALRRLEDLHEVGWGRVVRDWPSTRGSGDPGLPVCGCPEPGCRHAGPGSRRARDAFRRLAEVARRAAVDLEAVVVAADRVLRAGPPAESSRGSLLGDEGGHGAQAELDALRRAQDRRRARGEYVPERVEPQKRTPGGR